jgi:hypothetical protein
MVITDNTGRFDAGADQEIHQDALDFGLARFEIVPGYENVTLVGHLEYPWYESVLGGSVEVGAVHGNSGVGEEGRRGDFRVVRGNREFQVGVSVVDAFQDVAEAFRVRSPQDYDVVHVGFLFEVFDVFAELLDLLQFGSFDYVIGAAGLKFTYSHSNITQYRVITKKKIKSATSSFVLSEKFVLD